MGKRLTILLALLSLALLPGCRRAPATSAVSSEARELSKDQAALLAVHRDAGDTPASPLAPQERSAASLASIDQRYLAAGDTMTKVELIGEIAALGDSQAMGAFSHLFQSERDADLKVALLAAAMVQEECAAQQYSLYVSALWNLHPPGVRRMAVEGLAVLHTAEAREMLRGLQFDPDAQIRAAASEALAPAQ